MNDETKAAEFEPFGEEWRQELRLFTREQLIDYLARVLKERKSATERADEYEQLFEMQRQAERRGIEMWRSEKPGRELREPDSANFTMWLLNRIEFDETVFAELRERAERAEAALRIYADADNWANSDENSSGSIKYAQHRIYKQSPLDGWDVARTALEELRVADDWYDLEDV